MVGGVSGQTMLGLGETLDTLERGDVDVPWQDQDKACIFVFHQLMIQESIDRKYDNFFHLQPIHGLDIVSINHGEGPQTCSTILDFSNK